MSVTLHTTVGDLKIEVFCESVPKTAENFLALCATGYYDHSPIHRLIPTFIFQTGTPYPTTTSPLGYTKGGQSIYSEPFEDEIRPTLCHNARGIVAMANKGPATNGSQFYITFGPAPHLDGKNTVLGHVLDVDGEGGVTMDRIEKMEIDRKNRPTGKLEIERVTIHANPLADS